MRSEAWIVLLIAHSILIFSLSSIPGNDIPSQISPYSYLLHFLLYIPYGALALLSLRRWDFALLLSAAYAASDEIHQYFVPGRTCSFLDFLADLSGIIVGIIGVIALKKILLEKRE